MDQDRFQDSLHVVFGDSAGGSLKVFRGLRPDRFLICVDPISCGPAPATDNLDLWSSRREAYLNALFGELTPSLEGEQVLRNVERLGREKSVIFWSGLSLDEQLILAWLVFVFDLKGIDHGKLRVIQFEEARPGAPAVSMGIVCRESLLERQPDPRSLGVAELAELRRAWSVFTSSDPADLVRYLAEPGPIPLLQNALRQLVYRYPDRHSGLSIWDERLLRQTTERSLKAARVVGQTLGYDSIDYVGDQYLFERLIALGSPDLASPPVSIVGSTRAMRFCDVAISAFGEKVLAGEANHVEENGIDDWIGGVHLTGERPVTYRDGDTLLLPR